MSKLEQLALEAIEANRRGECKELTDEDFGLTPEEIKEFNKEVEQELREYELEEISYFQH